MSAFKSTLLLLTIACISTTRARFRGSCGRFDLATRFSNSENFHLKYRNNGNAVLVSATQCSDYENHLKLEAVAIKKELYQLQLKYNKKIKELVKLKTGELVSKKNLASTFSCDQKTGSWRLNREASFKCSPSSQDGADQSTLATEFKASTPGQSNQIHESGILTSEINNSKGDEIHGQRIMTHSNFDSIDVLELVSDSPSSTVGQVLDLGATPLTSDRKNCGASAAGPINIDTNESEEATGIYLNNMEIINNFINSALRDREFSGYLERPDKFSHIATSGSEGSEKTESDSDLQEKAKYKYKPLRYKFKTPIDYNSSIGLKCAYIDFYLQGSQHTLDGAAFDGEMQLNCWVSSKAETFEEALAHTLEQDEVESLVQVFSFFIAEGAINVDRPDSNLISAVIKGKAALDKRNSTYVDLDLSLADLPEAGAYFGYIGALNNTPGHRCSPNVNWSVFKSPIFVNSQQAASLKRKLFDENYDAGNESLNGLASEQGRASSTVVRSYHR